MESSITMWQALTLSAILGWVVVSSLLDLTPRLRSLIRPWVTRRVLSDTPLILKVQSCNNGFLDILFSVLSCIVSVSFYTAFLPFLYWSGHGKLGRQITMLLVLCDYIGNAIKDLVSAPRPSCPPVRRFTATNDEKANAMEYGLPSSHALNTVCFSGYFLHYFLTNSLERDRTMVAVGLTLVLLLVFLICIGRIYLGMHSLIDVLAGITIGIVVLAVWLRVQEYVDDFIVAGQNVMSFWAGLSLLACFAYPKPEHPNPSFDYHISFIGGAFGLVIGIQQTYFHFHLEDVSRLFGPELTLSVVFGRVLVGIPTILIVKFCSKALSKWLLPVLCNTLGIPITSSCYIPALKGTESNKNKSYNKQWGYLQKLVSFFPRASYDIDTGIRFFQYAGMAWSVVDFVPSLFYHLGL